MLRSKPAQSGSECTRLNTVLPAPLPAQLPVLSAALLAALLRVLSAALLAALLRVLWPAAVARLVDGGHFLAEPHVGPGPGGGHLLTSI